MSGDLTSELSVACAGRLGDADGQRRATVGLDVFFATDHHVQNGISRLTYTLDNTAAVGATSVSLSDTLPAGVVVVAGVPFATDDLHAAVR